MGEICHWCGAPRTNQDIAFCDICREANRALTGADTLDALIVAVRRAAALLPDERPVHVYPVERTSYPGCFR